MNNTCSENIFFSSVEPVNPPAQENPYANHAGVIEAVFGTALGLCWLTYLGWDIFKRWHLVSEPKELAFFDDKFQIKQKDGKDVYCVPPDLVAKFKGKEVISTGYDTETEFDTVYVPFVNAFLEKASVFNMSQNYPLSKACLRALHDTLHTQMPNYNSHQPLKAFYNEDKKEMLVLRIAADLYTDLKSFHTEYEVKDWLFMIKGGLGEQENKPYPFIDQTNFKQNKVRYFKFGFGLASLVTAFAGFQVLSGILNENDAMKKRGMLSCGWAAMVLGSLGLMRLNHKKQETIVAKIEKIINQKAEQEENYINYTEQATRIKLNGHLYVDRNIESAVQRVFSQTQPKTMKKFEKALIEDLKKREKLNQFDYLLEKGYTINDCIQWYNLGFSLQYLAFKKEIELIRKLRKSGVSIENIMNITRKIHQIKQKNLLSLSADEEKTHQKSHIKIIETRVSIPTDMKLHRNIRRILENARS